MGVSPIGGPFVRITEQPENTVCMSSTHNAIIVFQIHQPRSRVYVHITQSVLQRILSDRQKQRYLAITTIVSAKLYRSPANDIS